MQAHRQRVDEPPPVHPGDIDSDGITLGKHRRGGLHFRWNAKRAREKIHRAERQDPQRYPGLDGDAGGCRDRAVATADDDGLGALGFRRPADGGNCIATGGNLDAYLVPGATENIGGADETTFILE